MKIVLATLLSRFDLRLTSDAPPRPIPRAGSIGPEGGVHMPFVDPRCSVAVNDRPTSVPGYTNQSA